MKALNKRNVGDKISVADCTLERITSYHANYDGKDVLLFRHAIRTPDNTMLVYTGGRQHGREGQKVDVKGTIKRFENSFGIVRISRPTFSLSDARQLGMRI